MNNGYSSLSLQQNSTSLNTAESGQQNAVLRAMVSINSNVPISAANYGSTGRGTSFAHTLQTLDPITNQPVTAIAINSGTNFFNAANFYD